MAKYPAVHEITDETNDDILLPPIDFDDNGESIETPKNYYIIINVTSNNLSNGTSLGKIKFSLLRGTTTIKNTTIDNCTVGSSISFTVTETGSYTIKWEDLNPNDYIENNRSLFSVSNTNTNKSISVVPIYLYSIFLDDIFEFISDNEIDLAEHPLHIQHGAILPIGSHPNFIPLYNEEIYTEEPLSIIISGMVRNSSTLTIKAWLEGLEDNYEEYFGIHSLTFGTNTDIDIPVFNIIQPDIEYIEYNIICKEVDLDGDIISDNHIFNIFDILGSDDSIIISETQQYILIKSTEPNPEITFEGFKPSSNGGNSNYVFWDEDYINYGDSIDFDSNNQKIFKVLQKNRNIQVLGKDSTNNQILISQTIPVTLNDPYANEEDIIFENEYTININDELSNFYKPYIIDTTDNEVKNTLIESLLNSTPYAFVFKYKQIPEPQFRETYLKKGVYLEGNVNQISDYELTETGEHEYFHINSKFKISYTDNNGTEYNYNGIFYGEELPKITLSLGFVEATINNPIPWYYNNIRLRYTLRDRNSNFTKIIIKNNYNIKNISDTSCKSNIYFTDNEDNRHEVNNLFINTTDNIDGKDYNFTLNLYKEIYPVEMILTTDSFTTVNVHRYTHSNPIKFTYRSGIESEANENGTYKAIYSSYNIVLPEYINSTYNYDEITGRNTYQFILNRDDFENDTYNLMIAPSNISYDSTSEEYKILTKKYTLNLFKENIDFSESFNTNDINLIYGQTSYSLSDIQYKFTQNDINTYYILGNSNVPDYIPNFTINSEDNINLNNTTINIDNIDNGYSKQNKEFTITYSNSSYDVNLTFNVLLNPTITINGFKKENNTITCPDLNETSNISISGIKKDNSSNISINYTYTKLKQRDTISLGRINTTYDINNNEISILREFPVSNAYNINNGIYHYTRNVSINGENTLLGLKSQNDNYASYYYFTGKINSNELISYYTLNNTYVSIIDDNNNIKYIVNSSNNINYSKNYILKNCSNSNGLLSNPLSQSNITNIKNIYSSVSKNSYILKSLINNLEYSGSNYIINDNLSGRDVDINEFEFTLNNDETGITSNYFTSNYLDSLNSDIKENYKNLIFKGAKIIRDGKDGKWMFPSATTGTNKRLGSDDITSIYNSFINYQKSLFDSSSNNIDAAESHPFATIQINNETDYNTIVRLYTYIAENNAQANWLNTLESNDFYNTYIQDYITAKNEYEYIDYTDETTLRGFFNKDIIDNTYFQNRHDLLHQTIDFYTHLRDNFIVRDHIVFDDSLFIQEEENGLREVNQQDLHIINTDNNTQYSSSFDIIYYNNSHNNDYCGIWDIISDELKGIFVADTLPEDIYNKSLMQENLLKQSLSFIKKFKDTADTISKDENNINFAIGVYEFLITHNSDLLYKEVTTPGEPVSTISKDNIKLIDENNNPNGLNILIDLINLYFKEPSILDTSDYQVPSNQNQYYKLTVEEGTYYIYKTFITDYCTLQSNKDKTRTLFDKAKDNLRTNRYSEEYGWCNDLLSGFNNNIYKTHNIFNYVILNINDIYSCIANIDERIDNIFRNQILPQINNIINYYTNSPQLGFEININITPSGINSIDNINEINEYLNKYIDEYHFNRINYFIRIAYTYKSLSVTSTDNYESLLKGIYTRTIIESELENIDKKIQHYIFNHKDSLIILYSDNSINDIPCNNLIDDSLNEFGIKYYNNKLIYYLNGDIYQNLNDGYNIKYYIADDNFEFNYNNYREFKLYQGSITFTNNSYGENKYIYMYLFYKDYYIRRINIGNNSLNNVYFINNPIIKSIYHTNYDNHCKLSFDFDLTPYTEDNELYGTSINADTTIYKYLRYWIYEYGQEPEPDNYKEIQLYGLNDDTKLSIEFEDNLSVDKIYIIKYNIVAKDDLNQNRTIESEYEYRVYFTDSNNIDYYNGNINNTTINIENYQDLFIKLNYDGRNYYFVEGSNNFKLITYNDNNYLPVNDNNGNNYDFINNYPKYKITNIDNSNNFIITQYNE